MKKSQDKKRNSSRKDLLSAKKDGKGKDGDSTLRKLQGEIDVKNIGSYRVGEKIGKGAFGSVFKAMDTDIGEFVAIKRVGLLRLLTEGHLMEQLNHPNIVRFIGAIESDKFINLIIEFVDSGSLSQVLQKYGNLSERLVAIYMRDVLEGLKYLHSNGVVHRDIKSQNLLIRSDGTIKLADFGIAHLYTENTDTLLSSKMNIGSPYWMAPEVIQLIEASPASDMWSVACTVLELLTGKPPYYERNKTSACFSMVEDDHPPLPMVSKSALAFLMRCFKKDPQKRATSAELLTDIYILSHNRVEQKQMKKHLSITKLPRFQIQGKKKGGHSKSNSLSAKDVKRVVGASTLSRKSGTNQAQTMNMNKNDNNNNDCERLEEELGSCKKEMDEVKKELGGATKALKEAKSALQDAEARIQQLEKDKLDLENKSVENNNNNNNANPVDVEEIEKGGGGKKKKGGCIIQ